MRRIALLAMLALALTMTAWANSVNSVDFQFGGGTMSASGMIVSVSSTVDSISVNKGPVMFVTGPASISMMLSGSPASSETINGGSLSAMGGGNTFVGTIDPGGAWTVLTGSFAFAFEVDGTLNGKPTEVNVTTGSTVFTGGNPFAPGGSGEVDFASGDAFGQISVPEPGTLSLLGTGGLSTGFVGIAGFVRRRLRSHV